MTAFKTEPKPGPLLRATRSCGGEEVLLHMPLGNGTAQKEAAYLLTMAAKAMYMEDEGMSEMEAEARAMAERWTSHAGRRGMTTEALRLLREMDQKQPGTVPLNVERLVNIHMKWTDGEQPSQDMYTGMMDLEVLLLITYVL